MRKITSLLMLLCFFAGAAWAQLVETSTAENPDYYLIASYNRGGYLTNAGVGSGVAHVDATDGSYWYFEKANENGGIYFVNKLKDGENKIYLGSDKTASTTPAVWYVLENGVNTKGYSISSINPISETEKSCIDANNYNEGVGSWYPSSNDWEGTTWVFANVVDATYNPNDLVFRSRSDRSVNSVSVASSLGTSTVTVNRDYTGDNGLCYIDMTSTTVQAIAGEDLTVTLNRNGNWTHAYVYIDTDGTAGFSASVAADGYTPAGDLVSYSFYSGNESDDSSGKNSAGTELTGNDRNTLTLPAFKAPTTPGTYRIRVKHDWNSIDPNGGNANFMSNGGSFVDFTLKVVDASSTIEVNYSFTYGGVEKYTQTSQGTIGEAWPTISIASSFPLGITATAPEGVIEAGDVTDGIVTKVIALEENLPFIPAADYASITNWYYLKFHSNSGYYLYYNNSDSEVLNANKTAIDTSNKDAYTWAFVGNPFDGFKVVNKLAGSSMAINSEESGAVVSAGSNNVMKLTASSHGTNGFFMQATTGNYKDRFNVQDYKVVYWSGADAGSTFQVEERDMTGRTELQALVDEVEAANYTAGDAIGYYTQSSVDAVDAVVAAAKTALEGEMTDAISTEHQVAINNAVAALIVNMPTPGAYYRLKNVFRGTYISANATGTRVKSEEDNANASLIWTIEQDGETYKFKNLNYGENGYMKAANGGNDLVDAASAASYTLRPLGDGQFNLVSGSNLVIYNSGELGGWGDNPKDSDGAWYFLPATELEVALTKVGGASYATGYYPFPVSASGNTTLNVGTLNADKDKLGLTAVEGVPANTGVVIVNSAAETTATLSIGGEYSVSSNALTGSCTAITENISDYLVLGVGATSGALGFYETTATEIPANKAFLAAGSLSAVKLDLGGDVTTIENVELGNTNAPIFDLSGRRVLTPIKGGVYIQSGKKFIVK